MNIDALLANLHTQMIVGGHATAARSGKTFAVYDPATGREIAQVPDGDAEDIAAAVAVAKSAFESNEWRRPRAEHLLLKLAGLVEQHGDELAALETLNQGKLLGFS